MDIRIPSINDILATKIQDISARLPVPMSGISRVDSASFAAELALSMAPVVPETTPANSTGTATGPLSSKASLVEAVLGSQGSAPLQAASEAALAALQLSMGRTGTQPNITTSTASTTWPRLDITQRQTIQPRIDNAIATSAASTGLDPLLLRALIAQESAFQPFCLSSAGAMGLTQLMPGTASDLGVTNPYDIDQNVNGGARYLSEQLEAFGGDLSLALAAYNAGPNAVRTYGGVPPYAETRDFIDKVLTNYNRYRAAEGT